MKNPELLCCTAVVILAVYLAILYGPYAESTLTKGNGDSACDRQRPINTDDVISQKFMRDHICLVRKSPPNDLVAFCRDFRKGQSVPLYQVMLLSTDDIKQLRNDLMGHQGDFYNNRSMFRPLDTGASKVHYTTDQSYTFIYCELKQGKWNGKRKAGLYQQYIPKGTAGNPQGVYKIFHGCPPVDVNPGFSQPGPCPDKKVQARNVEL